MANVIFSYTSRLVNSTLGYLRGLSLLFFLSLSSILFADQWVNTEYNTTEGNEFYVTTMKNGGASGDKDYLEMHLYATANAKTRICVTNRHITAIESDGIEEDWTQYFTIEKNTQISVKIPLDKIYTDLNEDHLTYRDKNFSISESQMNSLYVYTCDQYGDLDTSQPPISLYITNYNASQGYEASCVLPINALERSYMVQTYHTDGNATEFAIVATQDNQAFYITAKISEFGIKTSTSHQLQNDTTYSIETVYLNRGETFLFQPTNYNRSFTGTIICSDYAFVLACGNQSAGVPYKKDPRNHIFEQHPSADRWGKKYIATPTYNHANDYILLTAIEDNTSIFKDGVLLTTLQRSETYTDTINADIPYYTANKAIICCLYETSTSGKPSMTTITPLELGVNSMILTAFNANIEEGSYNPIDNHYINIVTQTKHINQICIDKDNQKITGFKKVPGNPEYSYVQYHITEHNKPHLIYSKNKQVTFTTRMYGHVSNEDGKESYAYNGGFRVNRPVDMLINDKYIDSLKVCINDRVKFTSLIGYDYDNITWEILNEQDSLVGSSVDSIYNHTFTTPGLHDVLLHVYSHTPICDYQLEDIVTAKILVDTLTVQRSIQQRCIGDEPFKLLYKGDSILLAADTATQIINGETFKLRFDTKEEFVEIIDQDSTCDIRLIQTIYLRRTYNHSFDTTACDKWVWVDSLSINRKKNYDTIQVFTIEPGDKLPVWKEHTHHFNSKYGCDSIVTWRVLLNKSYNFTETVDACQAPGGVYEWEGHDTIHIPLDTPGEFTYTDYLTTQQEPYCDSIYKLILTVHPRYDTTEVVRICDYDAFTWSVNNQRYVGHKYPDIQPNDIPIASKTEFVDTSTTKLHGCDSIHRLEITVLPSYDTTYVEEICDNQTYKLNDTIIYSGNKSGKTGIQVSAQAEAYHFTHDFKTKEGCDSIIHLELYVHHTLEEVTDTAVCQVEEGIFTWEGHSEVWSDALQQTVNTIPINQAGTFKYIDSKTTGHGCDNVYTLNLTVYPTFYSEQDTVLSNEDYIQWQGKVIGGRDVTSVALDYRVTNDTTIRLTDLTIHGCDDIHVLNITYGEVIRDTVYAAVCDNDSIYEWYYQNRKLKDIAVPATAATYWFDETLESPIGIDSLIYLELAVFPTYQTDIIDSICTAEPYSWRALDDEGNANWIYDVQNKCMIDAGNILTTLPAGQQTPQTFVYIDSLKTKACSTCPADGCDSVYVLHLTVLPQYEHIDTLAVCDNDSITWNGEWFYGYKLGRPLQAVAKDTLIIRNDINEYGCLTYKQLQLFVMPTHLVVEPTDTTYQHICENETYSTDYGKEYNKNGEWSTPDSIVSRYVIVDTIQTKTCDSCYGIQCDSIVSHVIYVHPTYEHTTIDTICQHDSYTWKVTDNKGDTINITTDILDKDDHIVDAIETSMYGTFEYIHFKNTVDTLQCDSTFKLLLTILPRENTSDTLSLCENDSVFWQRNSTWIYGAKSGVNIENTYVAQKAPYNIVKIANNAYGCNYEERLVLTVTPTYVYTDTILICDNDENPFKWKPKDHNGEREILVPFKVDSTTNTTNKKNIICRDSIMLESIFGCDSLVYLYLEVNPTYKFVQQDTVCQDTINKYWTWHDKQGGVHDSIDISKSGTFIYGDTLKTTKQCDSIFGVELFVKPIYRFDSIYTICQNERIDWQGRGYTGSKYGRKSKYISKQIINDRGDTIAIHSDSIYYEYENGDRILEVGTYYDTVQYTTHLGCDSTYCLQVNVLPSYDTIIDATVCDKDSIYIFYMDSIAIDSISFEPITRMVDSVRKDTAFYTREKRLITKNGCDSTIYMHLTVYPTYEYITTANICQYDTFVWRGNKYSEKGQYKASLQTQYGCDSVYILDLFVKLTKKVILDTNICDNQTLVHSDTLWYENSGFSTTDYVLWEPGMEIPPSNAYQEISYPSADGKCDSVIYQYKIHVHPTSHQIDTLALCSNSSFILHDSLTIHLAKEYDVHYTVAPIDTIFIDTLLSEYGCDNTYEAHATIYPAYRYVTDTSVCENKSIIWRGIEFKKGEGEHRFTEPSDYKFYQTYNTKAYGYECDSIYELRLHVDPIQSRVIDTTICADCPYLFADTLLNTTGVYYDTIQTQAGCDSVLTLNLTVYDTTNVTIYDTICVTEKYKWHDRILTESGDYDTITINQWGCKDYHYLHLNVIDTTSYSLEIGDVLCADDEEIWVFYQYTGRMLIEYSVLFDAMGHAQGFQDIHHAPLDLNANYFSIPIPKGEVLPHPTPTYFDSQQGVNQYTYEDKYAYPLPQKYHMTVIMHNGICGDTLQRKDTIFDLLYPSWIHEQHWSDGVVLYNEQYNGGHIFTSYQWLQNGEKIIGATKEYLYIPSELWMNNRGECNNYYQVELTRLSDGYKTITCPICPVVLEDTIVPREDYYAIVPTTVVKENPVVHILTTRPGTYVVYYLSGNMILNEPIAFVPNEKNYASTITLPAVNGYYIVSMEMNNGDKRCVIVRVE